MMSRTTVGGSRVSASGKTAPDSRLAVGTYTRTGSGILGDANSRDEHVRIRGERRTISPSSASKTRR